MATYQSLDVSARKPVPGSSHAGAAITLYYEVACTAAPATTDAIQFGYVPAGFRLASATLEATDMDTGGPTLTLNVGDAGSATRIFSASTVAQAGTAAVASAVAGLGYQWTAKTLITGVAQANATTPAAGTLYLTLIGTIDDL